MPKMFIFLIVTLLLLGGVGYYLWVRLCPLMAEPGTWQGWLCRGVYLLVYCSFFVGFGLQKAGMYALSTPFTIVGSWALAAILYLLLFFVGLDVLRLISAASFKAQFLDFRFRYGDHRAWIASVSGCILVAVVLVCGYFNARFPATRHLVFKTDKEISRSFRYVLISDVHLGMIHCDHFMEILRDRLNSISDVDFVVVVGDFFDGDPVPVVESRVGDILRQVNTGYGIFACTGNHEWIGDVDVAADFLRRHGVNVLRDSLAELPFGVTIIGRDDLSRNHRLGHRKSLSSITNKTIPGNYKIVLDHQPARQITDTTGAGADVVLSGHTHAGAQLWPLGFFSRRMFPNEYGHMLKGRTYYYTTSGYGTWGPPIRTSARPEIVVIDVVRE